MSCKPKIIVLFLQIIATIIIISHFLCMKLVFLNTTRHHGKEMVCWLGMQYYSNKQIHESSHYLSYFPWEGQSSHANLCSDHWLAPGRSWPCDLPHKYHHHPLQKHQHQMPKCGYSGGNLLPQFVLSLKGSLQSPVTVYSSNLQWENTWLCHFLAHRFNSQKNVEGPVL